MAINLMTNDTYSLPPQVIGNVRGVLIFKISEIVLFRAPTAVLVQLQWWGESNKNIQNLGPIKVHKQESKKPICPINFVYNICTSLNLFYSYLAQCELVKVELVTAISNLKLGSAQVQIPHDLCQTKLAQNQAASVCNITNDDGIIVGELHINFQINFKDDITPPNSSRITEYEPITSRRSKLQEFPTINNDTRHIEKCSGLPKKYSKRSNDDDIASNNSIDIAISSRENVLKFLHGEDMSVDLQKQALKDIRNLSPASSLIALADAEHCLTKNSSWTHCPTNISSKLDSISCNTQKDSSISKYIEEISKITKLRKQNAMESNTIPKLDKIISEANIMKPKIAVIDRLINHVDSVRVTVQTLTLTRAGLRIVLGLENLPLVTISSQVTFFVEYAMPSLGKQQDNASNISRIRICAKSKDGQDVPFNRQSVHKVPLSAIMSNVPNPAIVFNVYYRKVSQRQAKHLGQCRITLNEIVSSPKLHSTRKCPIITSQNEKLDKDVNIKSSGSSHKLPEKTDSENVFSDVIGFGGILAGHLTVKVELGSGLLHFGKHFLESFAANQENISIPSTLTNSECNEEEIASTTFNGQFLDNQNRTLDCINHRNCAMFKQQQALPQERCTVCRDFYTNKPFLQKTQQQVYDAHIMKPIRKYNENKVTYQELKRPTIKKTIVKQSQNTKVAGCYLDQTILKEQQKGNEILTDSDDGKFVNTDLRGGKDIVCEKDQNEKKNILTRKSFIKRSSYFRKDRGKVADADVESRNEEDSTLLHGLLFVNEARGLEPQLLPQSYCLVNRGLCPGTGGSSKNIMCDGKYFQYLETFPLLCNKALMERCHSGHLIIEIWLKGPGPAQKLVGVASLPLHAFFVAYHDANMVRYLEKVKLPVISVDGWIPLLSPISGTVSGEIQALLAIGTEKQLEELRTSRNLKPDIVQMLDDPLNSPHQKHHSKSNKKSSKHEKKHSKVLSCTIGVNTSPIVVRQFATSISDINSEFPQSSSTNEEVNQKNYNTVYTQTTTDANMPTVLEESESITDTKSSNAIPLRKPNSFGNLSTFVSQLMQNIPQNSSFLTNFEMGLCSEKSSAESAPRLKQTSDLLAELQRALEHVPQAFAAGSDDGMNQRSSDNNVTENHADGLVENELNEVYEVDETRSSESIECFKASIEVEQALRLAVITSTTKKCHKRSKCKTKVKTTEIAPSTYVTFPAIVCRSCSMVQAPEGPVVATNVVPNTCNPTWKQKFDVALPVDLLKTDPKQLVFKIWRKRGSSTNIDLNAVPVSDVVIGFAVVDLSTLLSGLPSICGWFNITDVGNRCNGQIKISITPLENLDKFINDSSFCCSDNDTIHSFNSSNDDKVTLVRLTKSKEKMMEMLETAKSKLYGFDQSECMDINETSAHEVEVDHNINIGQVATNNADVNSNMGSGSPSFRLSSNPCDNEYQQNQQNVTPNIYSNFYHNTINEHYSYQTVPRPEDAVSSMNQSIITDILNHNPNQGEIDDDTLNTTSLSRVLKRKFTELHEITQRLRSRLLDVTKDDDDEFERDLNTVSDEKEYGIRPEDFESLAKVVPDTPHENEMPEDENKFENLANNYQNLLAVKQSYVQKSVDEVDVDAIQKELAANRDILSQRKCNINSLLQKLTLLTNPLDNPPPEKHVKFNSDVEVLHNESSNIFELIPGSEFNAESQSMQHSPEDDSSIESESTSKSGSYQCKSPDELETVDQFEENLNHSGKFHSSSQYKYSSEQYADSRFNGSSFPRVASAGILKHPSFERRNEVIMDRVSAPETNSVQNSSDEAEEEQSTSRTVDLDVRDVITNILKITEMCPNISKDTGLEDVSSRKSNSSTDEGEKKDQDTTGIYSDFCDS